MRKIGDAVVVALSAFLICVGGLAAALLPQTQPNVLLVVADDLGPQAMAELYARSWMPHLQANVITPGMTFTRYYAPDPNCCPGRASLFSGKYTHNHGVWMNMPPYGGAQAFDDTATIFTAVQAAGWRTGFIGKVLNSKGDWGHLTPTPRDDPEHVWPGVNYWYEVTFPANPESGNGGAFNYTTGESIDGASPTFVFHGNAPADYQTDVLSAKAVAFVQTSQQPWFLVVTPHSPHADWSPVCTMNDGQTLHKTMPAPRHVGLAAAVPLPQPPSFNEADVTDKPASIRALPQFTPAQIDCLTTVWRSQLESMMSTDDMVGAITTTLASSGQLANTRIAVTTDNGFVLGHHREYEKRLPYEESMRGPLYVRGPGVVAGVSSRFVLTSDLAPTIAEWTGATMTTVVDGRSLVPVLANPAYSPWRKRFLMMGRSGQTTGYSGVRTTPEATDAPNEAYVVYSPAGSPDEQYDMANDAGQLSNLFLSPAAPWPAHRVAMAAMLAKLKTCVGPTCRAFEDE